MFQQWFPTKGSRAPQLMFWTYVGYCGDDCNQGLLLSLRTQGPGMLNSLPQEQSPCNKKLYCQNANSIYIDKDRAFLACVLATLSSSASLKSKSIYSRKPSPSTSLHPFYFPLLYSYGTELYSFLEEDLRASYINVLLSSIELLALKVLVLQENFEYNHLGKCL